MSQRLILLLKVLEMAGIHAVDKESLLHVKIDRDVLLNNTLNKSCYDMIDELKTEYCSDSLTCLHKNSINKQKNHSICMIRQLLKVNQLRLKPKKLSCGYDKTTGQKIVKRYYLIDIL